MILRKFHHTPLESLNDPDPAEYVVSGHRFNIFEDIGCFPATYNTTLAYPLVYAWPLVIGLISAVYCGKYLLLSYWKKSDLSISHDHFGLHKETQAVPGPDEQEQKPDIQPVLPTHVTCWHRPLLYRALVDLLHLSEHCCGSQPS
jgi:hypothetical protein